MSNLLEHYDKATAEFKKRQSGELFFFNTGFPKLDAICNFTKECSVVLAGEQGSGKTALAMRMIWNMIYAYSSEPHDIVVNIFTFDVSGKKLLMRELTNILNSDIATTLNNGISLGVVSRDRLLSKYSPISEDLLAVIEKIKYLYSRYKVYIYDLSLPVSIIERQLQTFGVRFKDTNTIVVNMLDHFKLVKGDNEMKTITDISRVFKDMRNEYGFFNILLSQYNKSLTARSPNPKLEYRPQLSDVYGGGAIIDDTDITLALAHPYRNGLLNYEGYNLRTMKHPDSFRVIHGLKVRDNEAEWCIGLNCNFGMQRFEELSLPSNIQT
jgi:replicative DNA helicase